ncbi:MAG: hypothetical protein V3S14_05765 [Anaerolineae bacterium]
MSPQQRGDAFLEMLAVVGVGDVVGERLSVRMSGVEYVAPTE